MIIDTLQAISDSIKNIETAKDYLASMNPVLADRELCSALLKLRVTKMRLEKQ